MSIRITERHMQPGGSGHEHIARLKWVRNDAAKSGENSRAEIIKWIEQEKGEAYVSSGGRTVSVRVVHATPPYLRTWADGVWTDNLLALPEY